MPIKIRLRRMGRKKQAHYRIVVADTSSPRDGRFVESLGYYKPLSQPARVVVDMERVDYWVGQGALASETMTTILKKVRKGGDESLAVGEVDQEAERLAAHEALAEKRRKEAEALAAAEAEAAAAAQAKEDSKAKKEEAAAEDAEAPAAEAEEAPAAEAEEAPAAEAEETPAAEVEETPAAEAEETPAAEAEETPAAEAETPAPEEAEASEEAEEKSE